MRSCLCCFEDWIGPCVGVYDLITINTNLTPGGVYFWRITDKFSKIYQGETVATNDGKIQIPCEELPEGFFTAYSGEFTIEILSSTCKPISFPLSAEYDCVQLSINGGNTDKREIGCEVACKGGGGGQNLMFPFLNGNDLVINWAPYIEAFGNDPLVQVYQQDNYDNSIYALVGVEVLQLRNSSGVLQEIHIDFGGPMTGYVLIS